MAVKRPDSDRKELLGYSDRPNTCGGERIQFMVSSEFENYQANLVRLMYWRFKHFPWPYLLVALPHCCITGASCQRLWAYFRGS